MKELIIYGIIAGFSMSVGILIWLGVIVFYCGYINYKNKKKDNSESKKD